MHIFNRRKDARSRSSVNIINLILNNNQIFNLKLIRFNYKCLSYVLFNNLLK